MAKMPNVERAVVEQRKAQDYLLDLSHSEGGGKAQFFIAFGFTRPHWEELCAALVTHAGAHEAIPVAAMAGLRYRVEGPLLTPSGRTPWVRAIWEIKNGPPRLVTAYAMKAPRDD